MRSRAAPAAPASQESSQHHEGMNIAMEALRAQLASAREDLERARNETTVVRGSLVTLQERLSAEAERRATAEGSLAAEQAVSAGLRAQLETERRAADQLKEPLRQAIEAAAKAPVIVQPEKTAPPVYEVSISSRDGNNRLRALVIKPVKEG